MSHTWHRVSLQAFTLLLSLLYIAHSILGPHTFMDVDSSFVYWTRGSMDLKMLYFLGDRIKITLQIHSVSTVCHELQLVQFRNVPVFKWRYRL
jgi:hypothetical protein